MCARDNLPITARDDAADRRLSPGHSIAGHIEGSAHQVFIVGGIHAWQTHDERRSFTTARLASRAGNVAIPQVRGLLRTRHDRKAEHGDECNASPYRVTARVIGEQGRQRYPTRSARFLDPADAMEDDDIFYCVRQPTA